MSLILHDWTCGACGHEWEDLVSRDNLESLCPQCGTRSDKPALSTPGIASFSMMDQAGRAESLKKRSEKHTKKLMKQESDKIRHQMAKPMKKIGV